MEQLRVEYLGKKGVFTLEMKTLGKLPPDRRPVVGQAINGAKKSFQAELESRKDSLQQSLLEKRLAAETIDVTLPGRNKRLGSGVGKWPIKNWAWNF